MANKSVKCYRKSCTIKHHLIKEKDSVLIDRIFLTLFYEKFSLTSFLFYNHQKKKKGAAYMSKTQILEINHLEDKIEQTGGVLGDLMFSHLILSESDYAVFKDELEQLADILKVDFISVERTGPIEFQHVTDVDTASLIEQEGFKIIDEDFIGDIGKGIYGFQRENLDSLMNVQTYIAEDFSESEVAMITASHNGKYLECVFGYGHEGYILLKTDHIPAKDILNIEEFSVDEFLFL